MRKGLRSSLLRLNEEQRDQLAQTICQEIEASERAKGSLPLRWERNEKIYHVDPDVSALHVAEGMQAYNIPLYRQKADRVIGTVHSAITGLYPYVQALDDSAEGNNDEAVERGLQAMADDGDFATKFKQVLRLAVNTNLGTLRVRPELRTRAVTMDWIHPGNMMCYPSEHGEFREAKTVGHRFFKMRYRVEAEQRAGNYYEEEIFGGDDPNAHYQGRTNIRTETTQAVAQDEEQVELWEVIHECDLKGDGNYRRYLCVVAKSQQKLLACQEYPYSIPWYFDVRLDDAGGQVWPNDSLAQVMQGVQMAYSDIHTTLIHGSYMAAFPMVVVSGGALPVKAKKYGPSTLIESPTDVRVQAIATAFNPGALPMEGQKLEEVADSVSGISRLGVSEAIPASTTATAAGGMLQAQQERKDQYTESVSPAVARIWEFLYELLAHHFEAVRRVLGSRFPASLTYGVVMGRKFRFQVTGRNGASSPQSLLQKLQFLAMLTQNPQSSLDYTRIEERMLQALELPFSTQGLRKHGPSVQELEQLIVAMAQGQVTPQQAIAALQQDKNGAPA